jgi:hypothetical protein
VFQEEDSLPAARTRVPLTQLDGVLLLQGGGLPSLQTEGTSSAYSEPTISAYRCAHFQI